MPTIRLSGFQGIIPKTSPRLLPDGAAQTANNVKLTSGELAPYNGAWPIASQPTKTQPFLSIYHAVSGANSAWFSWPLDVDCVRMPFDVTNEARYAWTGDGIPRYATYTQATSGGANDYPKTNYALGIPVPVAKPTATPSGGVGAAVTRIYCHTFYNTATGEESGPSPFSDAATLKVDSTWAIAGMDVFPANSGTGTATATRFTNGSSVKHWLRVGDQVYFGGAPTTPRTVTAVPSTTAFDVTGASIAAETSWTRVVPWNTADLVRRLYRTSGSTAAFQLVADNISATTYNDTLLDTQILGDDLITTGWVPPPVDMACLRVTPGGSLVGISGNLICFSEPFQPHAWPTDFQFGCDFPLIGVGMAGTDVVGVTSANPYLVTGTDPTSMYAQKLAGIYPGLSKRSIVSDGGACYFATKSGMAGVQGGQVSIVTAQWFTQDEWESYNPETMFGAYLQDRVFLGYIDDSSNRRMLVFNFPYQQLTTLDLSTYALYIDETTGTMWVSTSQGICEFDSDSATPMLMEQWSKQYVLSQPCSFGAAKVVFDTGVTQQAADAIADARVAAAAANVTGIADGSISGAFGRRAYGAIPFGDSNATRVPEFPAFSTVTFTLYDADEIMFSAEIESTGAFRLPSGFKMDRPSVKINAQGRVSYVLLAETMNALRDA